MKKTKLILSSIIGLFLLVAFSCIVGNAAAESQNNLAYAKPVAITVFCLGLFSSVAIGTIQGVAFETSPVVSALTAYAGKFQKKLFSTLFNGLDVRNDITLIPGVKNKEIMTKLTVAQGVRPFNSTYNPPGDELTYTDRVLEVKAAKRELRIDPEKYRTTYLSEALAAGSGANKMEIPFAEYTWNEVMKGIARDINDACYLASYNAAGTTPGAICDGLGTIIAAEITATNITAVGTGAVTSANAVTKFEQMYKALPVAYQNTLTYMYCSYTNYFNYIEHYRATYGGNVDNAGLTQEGAYLKISGGKCIIKPCTWMGTSNRLILTVKENLLMGTDLLSDAQEIKMTPAMWTIDAGVKFLIGFQIRDLGAIKVNDQA